MNLLVICLPSTGNTVHTNRSFVSNSNIHTDRQIDQLAIQGRILQLNAFSIFKSICFSRKRVLVSTAVQRKTVSLTARQVKYTVLESCRIRFLNSTMRLSIFPAVPSVSSTNGTVDHNQRAAWQYQENGSPHADNIGLPIKVLFITQIV